MRKLVTILMIIIVITSACSSSNEDPTNIEMEVLRASLLEKELRIDKLQDSIEEHQNTKVELTNKVYILESDLEEERSQMIQLLDNQPQVLTIHKEKSHYYDMFNDDLYILLTFTDEYIDYDYEELYRYHKNQEVELIYRGEDIQFCIDESSGHLFVLNNDEIFIYDNELKLIYEELIDVNDPLIELSPTLYLDDNDYGKNYVLMSKYIQEDIPSLLALIIYDYRHDNDTIVAKYYMNTQNYIFHDERPELIYEEISEEGITLYKINFNTESKTIIAQNISVGFELYKENQQIYYFDESLNHVVIYESD